VAGNNDALRADTPEVTPALTSILRVVRATVAPFSASPPCPVLAQPNAPIAVNAGPMVGRATAVASQLALRVDAPQTLSRRPHAANNSELIGAPVTCTIRGERIAGTLLGVDYNGRPCIDTGEPMHRIGTWRSLRSADMQPASAEIIAAHPASDEARAYVDAGLDLPVCGSHTPREFVKAMTERGQETFIVGGVVRDIVAAVAHGDPLPAAQDIDLAVAASPTQIKTAVGTVSYDVPDRGITIPWRLQQHGTIRLGWTNGGLDITSLKVLATRKRAKHQDDKESIIRNVFAGTLLQDAALRDFHMNTLYYDPLKHTVLDPTGKGYAAAVNKALSFVDPEHADALIALRYFRFRLRGYTTTAETRADLRAIIERTWNANELGRVFYRGFPKDASEMPAYIRGMQRIAIADGVGDLFELRMRPFLASRGH
jgi:hypothetical protein